MENNTRSILDTIDVLQTKLDEVFQRQNTCPVYHTEESIRDAISDNIRYFPEDRKADLGEIFYAVLERIYQCLENHDSDSVFCNPNRPKSNNTERFPEADMLMRCMMPLSWALSAKWEMPEFANTADEYLLSYTPEQTAVIYDTLKFFFEIFPELNTDYPQSAEFLDYWKTLATDRDSILPESDELKSKMLTVLIAKKLELNQGR